MNKILILSNSDLPGALHHKTIETVSIHDFNETDIGVRTAHVVIYDEGDCRCKILKNRFLPEYAVGLIASSTRIYHEILPVICEGIGKYIHDMNMVKELSELAKKYNCCILTSTQAITPNGVDYLVGNNDSPIGEVFVEIKKGRNSAGSAWKYHFDFEAVKL